MTTASAPQLHAAPGLAVARLDADARATFLVRTYSHLAGAVALFVAVEIVLFRTGIAERITVALQGRWLLALMAFMLAGWFASRTAHRASSPLAQYSALVGYVLAEALIFCPLLYAAEAMSARNGTSMIASAAQVTLVGFVGLTLVAFLSGKDFSFLGALLRWFGVAALIGIVASLIFGFHLGTWFSVGMVVFAGAAVLWDTSRILHHYPADRYVGASLELFGSIALMFWYVLRIFMSRR